MKRLLRELQWHRKFAWLPTNVIENDWVWLGFYERRLKLNGPYGGTYWEIRPLSTNTTPAS